MLANLAPLGKNPVAIIQKHNNFVLDILSHLYVKEENCIGKDKWKLKCVKFFTILPTEPTSMW